MSDAETFNEQIAEWRQGFQETNATPMHALGLKVSENILNPDQYRQVTGALLDEGRGRVVRSRSFEEVPRIKAIAQQMTQLGFAQEIKDATGEPFLFSVTPPAPYTFESDGSGKFLDQISEIAEAQLLVRSATARVLWPIVNDPRDKTWKKDIFGGVMHIVSAKASVKEIIETQPHVLDGLSPYSRFDVVLGANGKPWVVDATPKSGGWGWWGRKGQLIDAQRADGSRTFELERLARGMDYLKQRAGLEAQDPVLVIGGEYLNKWHADTAVMSDNVTRIPVKADGFIPREEDGTYFDELTIEDDEKGVFALDKTGERIPVKGVAFWWGYEHLTKVQDPLHESGRERLFQLFQYAAEGKVKLINHPTGMQTIETKALIPMLFGNPEIQEQVVAELKKVTSDAEVAQMLETVRETTPPSHLIRVDARKGNRKTTQYDFQTKVWREVPEIHSLLTAFETPGFHSDYSIAKPIGGMGARGMREGIIADINNNLVAGDIYELQPRVETASFQELLLPHQYSQKVREQLTAPHVPRVEVFVTPTGPGQVELAGVTMSFLPGKSADKDARIHTGLNAFQVFTNHP